MSFVKPNQNKTTEGKAEMKSLPTATAQIGFSLMLALTCTVTAQAKQKLSPFDLKPMQTAIKLPAGSPLNLDINNADFMLTHEARNDIEIRVNYPRHWQVDDRGQIVQTVVAKCYRGVYRTQNHHTLVGQGTVAEGPGGSISMVSSGIYIDGKKLLVEKKAVKKGVKGLEMNGEGIFIDGHRVQNGSGRKGSDNEVDCVQVLVPENYSGVVALNWRGTLPAHVDNWASGALNIVSSGSGELELGDVSGDCSITATENGRMRLGKLSTGTKACPIKLDGSAQVTIKDIHGNIDVAAGGQSQLETNTGDMNNFNVVLNNQAKFKGGDTSVPLGLSVKNLTVKLSEQSHAEAIETKIENLKYQSSGGGTARFYGQVVSLEEATGSQGGLTIPRYYGKDNSQQQ